LDTSAVQDHGAESGNFGQACRRDLYMSLAQVASFIVAVTGWEGFAASVATKLLHKKRPKLIPILDNEAIFGAYMNPKWPEKLASTDCVYAKARIARRLRSAHPRVPQATQL
jgi:Family of unknown function (DUF6308)